MNLRSLSSLMHCTAKQAGLVPTFWFMYQASNDRTPEISQGSQGIV